MSAKLLEESQVTPSHSSLSNFSFCKGYKQGGTANVLSYCSVPMLQQSCECRYNSECTGRYNKNKKLLDIQIHLRYLPPTLSVSPYLTCSRDPSTLSASSRGVKEGTEV